MLPFHLMNAIKATRIMTKGTKCTKISHFICQEVDKMALISSSKPDKNKRRKNSSTNVHSFSRADVQQQIDINCFRKPGISDENIFAVGLTISPASTAPLYFRLLKFELILPFLRISWLGSLIGPSISANFTWNFPERRVMSMIPVQAAKSIHTIFVCLTITDKEPSCKRHLWEKLLKTRQMTKYL